MRVLDINDWWNTPRKASEYDRNRHVTGLEVFYDLVYSAYFARITSEFTNAIGWQSIIVHLLLFLMGWWSWVNFSMYFELHGNDDIRSRCFAFLQMFAVIGMSIYCSTIFVKNSNTFALFYILLQGSMIYLWWYTGVADKKYKINSRPYVWMLLLGLALFAVGLFLKNRWVLALWYISIAVMFTAPAATFKKQRNKKSINNFTLQNNIIISDSVKSRFNRMTVIIIAQIITGIISGFSGDTEIGFKANLGILAGLGLAFGIWTIYSETISNREVKPSISAAIGYAILHFGFAYIICFTAAVLLTMIQSMASGEDIDKYLELLSYGIIGMLLDAALFQLILVHKREHHDRSLLFSFPIAAVIMFIGAMLTSDARIILLMAVTLLFVPIVIRRIFFIKFNIDLENINKQIEES